MAPLACAAAMDTPAARFGASEADWRDWRWQLRHALASADALAAHVPLTDAERRGLALAKGTARVAVTPYYASLIDPARRRVRAEPRRAARSARRGRAAPGPRPRSSLRGPRAAARDRPLRGLLPPLHPPPAHAGGGWGALPPGPR